MKELLTRQFEVLNHTALYNKFGTYRFEQQPRRQAIEITHNCGLIWVIPLCSIWDTMSTANRIFDHDCVVDLR